LQAGGGDISTCIGICEAKRGNVENKLFGFAMHAVTLALDSQVVKIKADN